VGVPVASVRLPAQRNATIFPNAVKTTRYAVSGGIVRASGPPPSQIERVTSKKVETVPIDRVKARPTTLADAGVSRGSVRAALPAAERRSLDGKSAAAGQPEAKAKTASGHGTATTTSTHGSSGQAETHVAEKPAPKAKAPKPAASSESHVAEKPAPKAKAPKPAASSESHVAEKPAPKAKAPKPADSPKQKQPPPPAATDHESPGKSGTSETHVASHSTAPSAHGRPPQGQKANPPEKKPQPPAEKPQ